MNEPVIGVVGLGAMGSAVVNRLMRAGRPVVGYDLVEARTTALAGQGMLAADSPAAVARRCDVLLTLMPFDSALESVVGAADGIAGAGARALVVVEMSTLHIDVKLAMRDVLAGRSIGMLDCPISGTSAQAQRGDLAFYASGQRDLVEQVRPVLEAFGRTVYYLGAFGNGSRLKFAANLLVAIHNVAAAEALLLARRSGLDLEQVVRALADGAGGSRMLEVRGPLMVDGRYQPATMPIRLFRKDLTLIAEHARALAAPTPLLAAAVRVYELAREQGLDEADTAAVFAALEQAPQDAL